MGQLNLNEPKKYKAQNLEVLDSWIDQIMSGAISLDGKLRLKIRVTNVNAWHVLYVFSVYT